MIGYFIALVFLCSALTYPAVCGEHDAATPRPPHAITPDSATDPFRDFPHVSSPASSETESPPPPAGTENPHHLRPRYSFEQPYSIFHPLHPMNRKPLTTLAEVGAGDGAPSTGPKESE
jgi:hypothetical protein